ncbi:MAG: hypothetical protein ACNS62_23195 [Candidatus Cyclobacteriaceae bacterium M3_2C_046]
MKTIFDPTTLAQLVNRVQQLEEKDKALWGQMNPFQMLRDCTLSEEMFQGKKKYKRIFIGRLFGSLALKEIIKDEKHIKRNQPTHPEMKIRGTGDFENER